MRIFHPDTDYAVVGIVQQSDDARIIYSRPTAAGSLLDQPKHQPGVIHLRIVKKKSALQALLIQVRCQLKKRLGGVLTYEFVELRASVTIPTATSI